MLGSDTTVSELLSQVRFRRDHRWAPRHMSAFLDEELTRPGRARMARHAGDCPDCRRLMTGLERMVNALHGLRSVDGESHALQIAAAVRLRLDEPPAG